MLKNNPKTENYKFFQNKECEFFPCHEVENIDEFNCLFCYCPLYMLKNKCGGNMKYTNGFKDCSGCTVTHSKNAFDHVMSKMPLISKIGSEKE